MWSDDEVLDAVAGPIDAPALWRMQFWVTPIFYPFGVLMLEGDKTGAAAYLWVLSSGQADEVVARQTWLALGENDFVLQSIREMPEQKVSYWRHWPYWDMATREVELPDTGRDGVRISFCGYDGSVFHRANISNPEPESEPLHWQASREVFALLDELFEWNKLMAAADALRRKSSR